MDERKIENAKITSAFLGYDDHGILTAFLHLRYVGGTEQGFGGYNFNSNGATLFIKGVLEAVGVDEWDKLKGKTIRVDHDMNKVYKIGHIIEDMWYIPL